MTKTWIEPIYDRTYGNVTSVQSNPDQTNPKGCWNVTDINRIYNNTLYCAEWMLEKRIVRSAPSLTLFDDGYWTTNRIPTKTDIDALINNVRLLINLSSTNPAIANELPTIYTSTQINYVLANQIEYALDLMHDQPALPVEYWNVTITNGIVKTITRLNGVVEHINASTALVAEDETVTIRGVEYGDNASYQTFSYWSGNSEDLSLLVPNSTTQEVSFTMPYRAVNYTANFETHLPRTLTITNGYISVNKDPTASNGPTTGTYYAGDQIMIIATVAPSGKRFYEWLGTQAALDNIVGVTSSEDPSTAILTMPDCDVALEPHYINADKHTVTVVNGTGGGLYDYNELVTITATVPSHYSFSHWSSPYSSYLTDIYSSQQSFKMGDISVTFTANFTYQYSYNNIQVINGLMTVNGNNVSSASGLRQGNSYTLVPTPPDNSQGLYNWTIEGYGSVSGNTFTVGDGNAIITGNYRPYRTLTVNNRNNSGGVNTYQVVQGKTWSVSTSTAVNTNYKFEGWYENGARISTSATLTLTAGDNDRTVEARYEYYPTYTITVINRNNSGSTTTTDVVSGGYYVTSTSEDVNSYLFSSWSGDKSSSSPSIGFYVYDNITITANYREKEYYTLTVENGTGSGTYLERQSISVAADAPASGATFTGWTIVSGSLYQSPSGSNTTVKLGRSNATIRANYSNLRNIRIITNASDDTYSIIEGNSRYITSSTAPTAYKFDHWEVTIGDATLSNQYSSSTYVYAHSQDSTVQAIYTPIATYTVTMVDGYVWSGSDWAESATLLKDSTNEIKLKQGSVPTGYQFLQWEVYVNNILQTNANDVYQPFAETTRLNALSRNITIKATFFIPDPEVVYTLTIRRKDGSTEQNTYAAGANVNIQASTPDQGKEFYKWTGDTAYVAGGVYNSVSYVHMPAQNITIQENYVDEGYIPTFDLEITNLYGECCYTTEYEDPETHEITTTDHWVTRWSYPEGTTVRIRTKNIPNEYYFSSWDAIDHDTSADARSIVTSLSSSETTLTMPNYDVDCEPIIALKTTYELRVNGGYTGGQTSAMYYEGARADIYFGYENTNDIHYEFTRWTGDNVSQLELYDGGMFNVLTPGNSTVPQYIKMPGQATEVTATYTTKYRLSLTNATIDSTGETSGYFVNGTVLNITADTKTGMSFQHWSGDIDHIGNIYDPTTTIQTTNGTTTITAVYSNDADRNSVGYTTLDLKNSNTIVDNNITVISGEIEIGFILTDSNGHIYVITNIDDTTHTNTIYRMTKIVQGGNVYG